MRRDMLTDERGSGAVSRERTTSILQVALAGLHWLGIAIQG